MKVWIVIVVLPVIYVSIWKQWKGPMEGTSIVIGPWYEPIKGHYLRVQERKENQDTHKHTHIHTYQRSVKDSLLLIFFYTTKNRDCTEIE